MAPAFLQPPPGAESVHWFPLLGLPAIVIAVSLPLVFRLVPPNHWYGYRTPRSLSSPADWYRLNRIAGVALIAASLVSLAIKLAILRFVPGMSGQSRIHLIDPLVLLLTVVGIAAATERSRPSRPL